MLKLIDKLLGWDNQITSRAIDFTPFRIYIQSDGNWEIAFLKVGTKHYHNDWDLMFLGIRGYFYGYNEFVLFFLFRSYRIGDWLSSWFSEPYDDTEHLGCPSYPNCDESPLGCCVASGENVEWYGHKD